MSSGVEINPSDYLVLICDDEESIRSMLGEAIGGWGFQVATAPNGESGLEFLKAGNIPHILLTDIRMGGMTGLELAAAAKSISNEIEVVIMTSHGSFETAVQALRIGVYDYISKPFDNIEDVRTALVHVAERIYLKFYTEFLLKELERKNAETERLASMSIELGQNLDLAKVLDIGVRGISNAFDSNPAVFFQFIPSQKSIVATARHPANLFGGTQIKTLLPSEVVSNTDLTVQHFAKLGADTDFLMLLEQGMQSNPLEFQNLNLDPGQVTEWHVRPLVTRGVPRGVFAVLAQNWNEVESSPLMNRYVQTIATAFENSLLHAKVVQTAIRDSLTGLYNVRHFKERFQSELLAAARLAHPISMLFIDVDHFKKYNDTHGHPAGDLVLRMMADLMRKSFRSTDLLARYGGEEFVVLMPHTAFVDALEKAENFRAAVETEVFPNEHTQPLGKVTVSMGVSEFPSHAGTVEAVVKAADDALYEAKKKSRNVVVPGKAAPGYVAPFSSQPVRSLRPLDKKEA